MFNVMLKVISIIFIKKIYKCIKFKLFLKTLKHFCFKLKLDVRRKQIEK